MLSEQEKYPKEKYVNWQAPDHEKKREKRKDSSVRHLAKRWITWAMIMATAGGIFEVGTLAQGAKQKTEQVDKEKPLTAEQARRLLDQRKYIEQKIGPHVLDHIAQQEIQNRQSNPNKEPSYTGFEKMGINPTILKKLWQDGKTYPRHWIKGEIDNIKVVKPEEQGKLSYGPKEGHGAREAQDNQGYSTITVAGFEDYDKKDLMAALDMFFGHESGHSNDWEGDREATFAERIDLLARVHARMNAENHFEPAGGGYGEMEEVEDPEKREYYKAREYWGSLCEYYFTFPEILKEKNPEDFQLVDEWVKLRDPEFDPVKTRNLRNKVIEEYQNKINK